MTVVLEDEDARQARPDPGVLLAAVEATGEAILITSAELEEPGPRIEYVNPAFSSMTGYAAHEVLGRSPRFLQGPLTDRTVLDGMRAALFAGTPFQGEAINYRKDGTTYVVEWLITPLRDGEGRVTRWVSAQRDITERRAGEDRQALMVRELHHRVKNTLATVQAILNSSLRSAGGLPEFHRAFSNRIASLAKTHTLITEGAGQVVTFEELIRTELEAYDEPGVSARRLGVRGFSSRRNRLYRWAWRCTSLPPTRSAMGRWGAQMALLRCAGRWRADPRAVPCAGHGPSAADLPCPCQPERASAPNSSTAYSDCRLARRSKAPSSRMG